jgi:hypothetical protein
VRLITKSRLPATDLANFPEARFLDRFRLADNSPWSMSVAVWRLLALGANV